MKDAKGHGSGSRGGQQAVASWRAAHQGGVQKVPGVVENLKAFAKSESGAGHMPFMEHLGHAMFEDPTSVQHYMHFLGFLAAVAVVDVIICFVMGWPIT